MSLSQEPAFSTLKNNFVCGVHDISNEPYAGVSGLHEKTGNAVYTTNGAGPHNLQLFMLASDGTVLHCLPGYWNPRDLVKEMQFASELNEVWQNSRLTEAQKKQMFQRMQLSHADEHPPGMVMRSRMQSFDQKYEAEHRLYRSDAISHPEMISADMLMPGGRLPQAAFKTTDEIMHERMAQRPFLPFNRFDVADYVDYGKPKYDKHEDARNPDGSVNKELAAEAPIIGNTETLMKERLKRYVHRRMMMREQQGGINDQSRYSYRPAVFVRNSSGNARNSVRYYNW